MSAGLIFSLTYFVAESTARWTSSGCIELMSNSSTIRRRPASASEDIFSLGRRLRGRRRCGGRGSLRALRVIRQPRFGRGQQVRGLDPCRVRGDLFEGEAANRLRLAVLGDLEVGGRQPLDDVARRVADDDVDGDDLGAQLERRTLLRGGRRRCLLRGLERPRPSSRPRGRPRTCAIWHLPFVISPQNRNRKLSCADRMARTDRTWPKVGELTTVSIAA